jgi:hypothetical protein
MYSADSKVPQSKDLLLMQSVAAIKTRKSVSKIAPGRAALWDYKAQPLEIKE